jgi:hypothetical protein
VVAQRKIARLEVTERSHRYYDALVQRCPKPCARSSHNLRPAAQAQQMANRRKAAGCSSQFKGVSWAAGRGPWHAYGGTVGHGGRNLGCFSDDVAAARAFDAAAVEDVGRVRPPGLPASS